MALTVLVVDDIEVARAGLVAALESGGFEVVGQADSAEVAEEVARKTRPDVAVLDLRLPGSTGFEVSRRIARVSPSTRFLFVTAHEGDLSEDDITEAAFHGLILKTATLYELYRAVEQVAAGDPVVDPTIAKTLVGRLSPGESFGRVTLTQREREVFKLLSEGKGDIEISQSLGISPRTAKNYVSRVLHKLGLSRRSQVPAFAAATRELTDSRDRTQQWTRSESLL